MREKLATAWGEAFAARAFLFPNLVVIGIAVGWYGIVGGVFRHFVIPFRGFSISELGTVPVAATLVFGICGSFVWKLATVRPASPFRYVPAYIDELRLLPRLTAALLPMVALTIFIPAFSAAKSIIPFIQPFQYDLAFERLDVAIHGDHAWRLLQPVLGHPFVSFVINGFYHLWVMLIYVGLPLVAIWIERPGVRARALVAFFVCWILVGNVLATALSSVGPVFVEHFYGRETFKPLVDYLYAANEQFPLMALHVQESLVAWRDQNMHGVGSGISAMPSMHVSMATLFAIVGFRHSRLAGRLLTAFALIIQLGSVHLGYHYAIDGYFAAAVTGLIWIALAPVEKWAARTPRTLPEAGLELR